MPDDLPDDMRIPTRDEERQIAADASSTSGQVRGFQPVSDVGERLKMRRASTRGVVQFDVVQKREGGGTLAVSRQLVVPDGPGRNQADQVLTERGFVRRGLAVDDPRIEPLRDLAWVYTLEDGDADAARVAVDGALELLAGDGIPAAPTMVSALHMVFKSADGPSPTSVTIASFPPDGAALASPQEPVVIAVIDTGIDEHLRGDGWLNEVGRRSNDNVDLLDVFPAFGTPLDPTLDLGAGHGMFVSGVIRQVDPLAKIVVYRALDSDGLASEESVASAMIRAALDGAHVINLSLGIEPVDDVAPPALEAAVKTIMSLPSPPAIVASAGNNGTDEKVYPAAFEDVISVAALQAVEGSGASPRPWAVTDGADWSSFGGWVRCSAVGEGIISTFVKGKEDPEVGNDSYDQDSWAVWSGTSFAAPQIAAYIGWRYRQDRLSPQPSENPKALADALFPAGGGDSPLYGTRIVLLPGTKPNP